MDLAERLRYKSAEALKALPDQDWDEQTTRDFRLRKEGRASAFAEAAQILMEDAPSALLDDEELRQLLKDALLNNRAFVAGRAFGVPEEAYEEHLKVLIESLMPVVKSVMCDQDGGLEYARLYGVYPDGRKYNSEVPS